MKIQKLIRAHKFSGAPRIPGDKSVSHRALIFGALAENGVTRIQNLLESGDVQSTARCLQQMGVKIYKKGEETFVEGLGHKNFKSPIDVLDCGNSGTTMRLLMGLLSSMHGMKAEMTGDESLIKRPMKRVAEPLRFMGAHIQMTNENFAPLSVSGDFLRGIDYELKIASAQIKTAIILAGLFASGRTRITGEIHSRDHTERLLKHFGVEIQSSEKEVVVGGGARFQARDIRVPSDPSTAAFWLAGAALVPNSKIEMQNISLNPTRIGFMRVLQRMGAPISFQLTEENPEPVGAVTGGSAPLKAVTINESEIPSLIDELPVLAVLASQAHGRTVVTGAEELRVKETDRIEAVATNLRKMKVEIETTPDGFIIEGPQKLIGAEIESFHDHRIAMAFSIAALIAEGETTIRGADSVQISYPEFYTTLKELTA